MKKILSLLLLAGATVVRAETEKPTSILLDGVAAYVNTDTITIADVMTEVRRGMWQDVPEAERDKRLRELYKATLNALIDRKLILASAVDAKVQLQPWALDNRVREIIDQHFAGDKAKLIEALSQRHMSYEEWRDSIRDDLTLTMLRHAQVDQKINLSPGQIKAFYEANKQDFVTAGGVRVGMIMITPQAEGPDPATLAKQALEEIKAGATFAATARKYSKDERSEQGGSWGLVEPGEVFAAPLVEALSALKPGETSDVVMLGDNAYILLKEEVVTSESLALDQAWKLAESRLRMREQEKMYRVWTERMRSKAYIKILELPEKTVK